MDVVKGLKVSTKGEWSGDADLNDGYPNNLYKEYQRRLKAATSIGLKGSDTLELDLATLLQQISADLSFIHNGSIQVQAHSFT